MAIKLTIKIEDYSSGGYKHLLVDAVMLPHIGNISHFVVRSPVFGENFLVVEYETGLYAARGWTIGSAVTIAESNIHAIGEDAYKKKLAEIIQEYGKANVYPAPQPEGQLYRDIEKELNDLYTADHPEEISTDNLTSLTPTDV
jgi:hypothetical protein